MNSGIIFSTYENLSFLKHVFLVIALFTMNKWYFILRFPYLVSIGEFIFMFLVDFITQSICYSYSGTPK